MYSCQTHFATPEDRSISQPQSIQKHPPESAKTALSGLSAPGSLFDRCMGPAGAHEVTEMIESRGGMENPVVKRYSLLISTICLAKITDTKITLPGLIAAMKEAGLSDEEVAELVPKLIAGALVPGIQEPAPSSAEPIDPAAK